MNTKDPKLTALLFNEHINNQDIEALSGLMTEDHTFIDRENGVYRGKETMTKGWIEFFTSFPEYRNTFTRVESQDDLVILVGMPPGRRELSPIMLSGRPGSWMIWWPNGGFMRIPWKIERCWGSSSWMTI